MNNLDKLTEATILALQGKLIEKENPKNRVINAKIRQADKYIDDLIASGLSIGVYIDISSDERLNIPEELKQYISKYDDDIVTIPNKQVYDEILKTFGNKVTLYVGLGELDEYTPVYNVTEKMVVYIGDEGYEVNDVDSNFDIYNYLETKSDRIGDIEDDEYVSNNTKYRTNAKYSDDTLKNSPDLINSVKSDIQQYNTQKAQRSQLKKDIDKLSKTNDRSFKNDEEIITKSNRLDNVEREIRNNSRDDGSFDTNKARQDYKDINAKRTV